MANDSADKNVLSGVVKQVTYLGEEIDYRVQVSEDPSPFDSAQGSSGHGLELRVQTGAARRYRVGETVKLHLPPERLRLIAEE